MKSYFCRTTGAGLCRDKITTLAVLGTYTLPSSALDIMMFRRILLREHNWHRQTSCPRYGSEDPGEEDGCTPCSGSHKTESE